MDISYATIPTCENKFVTSHHEKNRRYHVEDPLDPMNELVFYQEDLGSYIVLASKLIP